MKLRTYTPAIAIFFMALLISAQARFSAPEVGQMGIIFAPWVTPEDAFLRLVADQRIEIVAYGSFSNIIIVNLAHPDSKTRIYDAGAWWIFDPKGLWGCFTPDTRGA